MFQAEIQKKECSRLSALETQLRRKEAELEVRGVTRSKVHEDFPSNTAVFCLFSWFD